MQNLNQFKDLIKRYNEITLKEIEKKFSEAKDDGVDSEYLMLAELKTGLTGFGSTKSCKLCIAVDAECSKCTWGQRRFREDVPCTELENNKTYQAINDAATPDELFIAYRKRAARMKEHLKYLGYDD